MDSHMKIQKSNKQKNLHHTRQQWTKNWSKRKNQPLKFLKENSRKLSWSLKYDTESMIHTKKPELLRSHQN